MHDLRTKAATEAAIDQHELEGQRHGQRNVKTTQLSETRFGELHELLVDP